MKLVLLLGLLLIVNNIAWSKPVEEDIDYELQKDDYNEDYEDDSIDKEDETDDDDDDVNNVMLTKPEHFSAKPDSEITLPCNVSGGTSTSVLMWKKNSDIIYQDKHIFSNFDSKKFLLVGTSLLIKNLDRKDAGEYTCDIIGGSEKLEVKHNLTIQSSPKITSLTADKRTSEYKTGDKLELTCNVEGEPEPKITWSLKGKRYGTGKTLILENIEHDNSGNYQCLAENGVGDVDHQFIEIKIMYKPRVSLEKITTNVNGDEYDVELRCTVHSEPHPIVLWFKDGIDVTKELRSRQKNKVQTVQLKNVDASKFGKYTCRAVNQIGTTEQHVMITNAPSKALYQEGMELNHGRDFNLTWEVESLFPISEYLLEFKKKEDGEWKQERPEVTNSESGNIYLINYILKELDAGEYEVRVKSKNQYGWSEDSKVTTFKARKQHHGHKNHKNHHQNINQNEEDNNIALENRVEGSSVGSTASYLLPTTSILCLVVFSMFNRH